VEIGKTSSLTPDICRY